MNTRRHFFGQIATLLATAAAPSLLLSKQNDRFIFKTNNATNVVFRTYKLKAIWTVEMEQDLKKYYNIDIKQVLTEYAKNELSQRTILRPHEKFVSINLAPPIVDPVTFQPRQSLLAKVKVYV